MESLGSTPNSEIYNKKINTKKLSDEKKKNKKRNVFTEDSDFDSTDSSFLSFSSSINSTESSDFF